jgi:hypothetical protein
MEDRPNGIAELCTSRGMLCAERRGHPFRGQVGTLAECKKVFKAGGKSVYFCGCDFPDSDRCWWINNSTLGFCRDNPPCPCGCGPTPFSGCD